MPVVRRTERNTRNHMSPYYRNALKPWSFSMTKELLELANENTPRKVIADKLGRSINSVQSKANAMGISLRVKRNRYGR